MSIRVMSQVWGLDLADSEMLILLALADWSDDAGACWPSIAKLVAKTRKSERTIQGTIRLLVDKGHMSREERPGRGCLYTVHPRIDCTPAAIAPRSGCAPAKAAPPQRLPRTPAAAADNTSGYINTPIEPDGSMPPAGAGKAKSKPRIRKGKAATARGSRLGDDWQAPPVADLSERVRRTVAEWPAGAYEHVAEMFRNHFLAEGRATGSKRDWSKAWSNWLLREHSAILRQVKAGVRFEPPVAATAPRSAEELAGEQAAIEHLAELRLAEGVGAAKVRSILRREMGATLYGQWLENTALGLSGDTLTVSVHSEFLCGWIGQHHIERISTAAREVLGRSVEVVCRLAQPPPS